jgi:hypothetical protein
MPEHQTHIAAKFVKRMPLRQLANLANCSYDHLRDLKLAGYLETLDTNNGDESTLELLHRAWRLRAEADLERRGVRAAQSHGRINRPSRKERAEQAAAALGIRIQGEV